MSGGVGSRVCEIIILELFIYLYNIIKLFAHIYIFVYMLPIAVQTEPNWLKFLGNPRVHGDNIEIRFLLEKLIFVFKLKINSPTMPGPSASFQKQVSEHS